MKWSTAHAVINQGLFAAKRKKRRVPKMGQRRRCPGIGLESCRLYWTSSFWLQQIGTSWKASRRSECFSSARETQQKKRNAILSKCSPRRSFDLGRSTENSNKHTDVKVHTDRQQWNNIALVTVGTKIQAVEDNSQGLKEKDGAARVPFVFGHWAQWG